MISGNNKIENMLEGLLSVVKHILCEVMVGTSGLGSYIEIKRLRRRWDKCVLHVRKLLWGEGRRVAFLSDCFAWARYFGRVSFGSCALVLFGHSL